jgi:hypothetical protein
MLQLKQEQDIVVPSLRNWKEQENPALAWCEALWHWLLPIRRRTVRLSPKARLARMITLLRYSRQSDDESALLERLEAEIAATDDVEVRKLLAAYLSEP